MGQLVFQATLGGQVNLVGPNTASTFNINVPAVAGNMVTTGDTGTVSSTMLASSLSLTTPNINVATATTINGLTVGKGAGSVATNTAVGASALATNSTGAYSTAVGRNALNLATGDNNTAVGAYAGAATTTGVGNSFFGEEAGVANTTGSYNTALGRTALQANTTASNNTAVGYQAGYSNTTGIRLTAVGDQAGYSNVSGAECTYIGRYAGRLATGSNNTFVGVEAGASATTGTFNSFFGTYSGADVTTGSKNTILGRFQGNQGGLDIRTANNYIVLSDGDGNPRGIFDGSGNLLVGTTTVGINNSYSFVLRATDGGLLVNHASGSASGSTYCAFGYNGSAIGFINQSGTTAVTYNTTSDYRLKENITPITGALSRVSALKPCTYTWKTAPDEIGEGFIAHELAEVCPQAVTGEKDAVDADGNPVYQGVDTSFLVATLTAAIQELKAEFDAYVATHP